MKTLIIKALALVLFTTQAFATDLLDTVEKKGVLTIGLEGTYPPFNFKDDKQQLTGFDVEIAKEIAKRLHLKPEFKEGEWTALLAGLEAHRFDIVVDQVAITPERQQVFDFSVPYRISQMQLMINKNETRKFNNLEDLRGKRLGVAQGTNYADAAKAVGGIDVHIYPSTTEFLEDLSTGRIDAVLNDHLLVPFLIKQSKLPVKAGVLVGDPITMAIPFVKGNPKFKKAIDKALLDMQADGTFKTISMKWFGVDVSKSPSAAK